MGWKLPAGRYCGSLVRCRQLPGFAFTESVYSPNLNLARHCHERAYCCFVMQGAYTEQYGSKIRDCSASTLVFHPSGEEHADRFHEKGGRLFRIEIEPGRLSSIRDHTPLFERPADFRGGRLAFLATHLYREFREDDPAAALAMEGLILEILAEATRSNSPLKPARPPRWLRQAHDLLHERFAEGLTLRTIADSAAVHPVHLVRSFRQFYGSTIGEYVPPIEDRVRQSAARRHGYSHRRNRHGGRVRRPESLRSNVQAAYRANPGEIPGDLSGRQNRQVR